MNLKRETAPLHAPDASAGECCAQAQMASYARLEAMRHATPAGAPSPARTAGCNGCSGGDCARASAERGTRVGPVSLRLVAFG